MSTHKNRVQMSVTGTPGTGTITLNAASSGYQSFATAYGANATVDILMVDGTAWEVARDCTYTNSGPTVTRGTFEASSTGSAISLTSAAVVSVVATADRGRTWDAAALNTQVAGTDADTTMAINTLYTVDMSAWATADRTYTLPATAAVGDTIGIVVTAGDASHELIITAGSGDTLNGIAGGTEWSRLFITGEVVVMRCVAANATWMVVQDGRIPCKFIVYQSSASGATSAANTYYSVTDSSGHTAGAWATPELDNAGGVWTGSTSTFAARRAGLYSAKMMTGSRVTLSSTNFMIAYLDTDSTVGGSNAGVNSQSAATSFSAYLQHGADIYLTAGQYIRPKYRFNVANIGASICEFQCFEVLP